MVFACLVVTFINPYGLRVWWEVGMQLSDPTLHWAVQEWRPAFFLFNFPYVLLLPISLLLILRYRKKFAPLELALYSFLLLLGLSSSRHVPFWLLIALPLTARALKYFYDEAAKIDVIAKKRFLLVYKASTLVCLALIAFDLLFLNAPSLHFSQPALLSEQAIRVLKESPVKGNIFAEYGLGGYLIWRYSEKKVFIDGRMPSWRREVAPKGESLNAFAEYELVMSGGKEVEAIFKKYAINTVVLSTEEESEWQSDLVQKLSPLRGPNKAKLKRELKRLGMREVYRDGVEIIYAK